MSDKTSFKLERALFDDGVALVVAIDEAGRGALAGPLCVAAVAVTPETKPPPDGLTDSKLLSSTIRQHMYIQVSRWVFSKAAGYATPQEIDEYGLSASLRIAASRAVMVLSLPDLSTPTRTKNPHVLFHDPEAANCAGVAVLLDGPYDFLTRPPLTPKTPKLPFLKYAQIHCVVKGDLKHSSIAAASVVAKVGRDCHMETLHSQFPMYDWVHNAGYGTATHRKALKAHGPCEHHRKSFKSVSTYEPQTLPL